MKTNYGNIFCYVAIGKRYEFFIIYLVIGDIKQSEFCLDGCSSSDCHYESVAGIF